MSTDLEDQLIAGMRDAAAGLTFRRDVLGEATRRHRRRTALHRSAYAAGVVGVVGALAAVVTGGAGSPGGTIHSPGPVAERSVAASPEPPQLRLAAAAAASENISYRVKVTTTSTDKPAKPGTLSEPESERWVTVGAFDPATATGYLDSPYTGMRPAAISGWAHERLIDGVRYVGGPDSADPDNGKIVWGREAGQHDSLDYAMAMGGGLGASASPAELFRVLGGAGATVTEKAPGVYHFEVTMQNPTPKILSDRLVGEVTVGADDRIAQVAYVRTTRIANRPRFNSDLNVVIKLSDYGLPVKVEVPAPLIWSR
ncbi:hypothetical protein ACGFI9_31950 [Micromonospora sp. NPDC048930]|uniref:hypothetical protein n=1 Tax=Micromonospora sp. NPDC048930 TaxID=3364261 RepID=UPI00371E6808